MAKVQIEEKNVVSGSFEPVTIGDDINVSMNYSQDGEKKSFFGIAKKGDKEVARCNWQPVTRLYLNVEPDIEAAQAVEIADTFVEGLKVVVSM